MLQNLKLAWSQLYNGSILPGVQQPLLAGTILAVDLVTSLLLFYAGHSIALSHITGFVLAGTLLLLHKSVRPATRDIFTAARIWPLLSYSLLQLALRAGFIASLSLAGVNEALALLAGIALAGFAGNYSTALLLALPERNAVSNEERWQLLALVLIVGAFALRLVFFGGMEVIPQEAYYWNYAQHLSPGYLDHPPLVAATIWSGEWLFGHSALGTRFGAILYGLLFIGIFYRYARLQVDSSSALLASALAVCLPYFFMGSGFLITPDAPLTLAWVMALYFFYRALVNNENTAWYGVGFAMGLGMLSKYSIALLAPAAAVFILIDPQARRVLLRKEPYLAVLVAIAVFSPVIYWNATHDWASFSFQASGRFDEEPKFYLDMMLGNIMAIVTPLPLLALPWLFARRFTAQTDSGDPGDDSPFHPRMRLFIGCFLLVPMSVFAWNALKYEPRYNWTGPLWITLLPLLAWLIINTDRLRWRPLAGSLRLLGKPLLFSLLCLYAVLLHFLAIGLPGVDYPRGMARLIGWPEVARNMEKVRETLPDPANVAVAGLDKYFIASKLSYYGRPAFLGENRQLEVTGIHLLQGNSLMFAYWQPAEAFRGKTVIMLTRSKSDLDNAKLTPYFEQLSPQIAVLPVYRNDFGLPKKTIRDYYYRIGYRYIPPSSSSAQPAGYASHGKKP